MKGYEATNFEFLRPENDALSNLGSLAEKVLFIDPGSALTRLRGFAEEATKLIYEKEGLPRLPHQSSLYELLKSPAFEDCVNRSLIHQLNFLRVQGNGTAHGGAGDARSAQVALGTAHQLAMYIAIKYQRKKQSDIPAFVDVPDPTNELRKLRKSVSAYEKEVEKQQKENQDILDRLERERLKNSTSHHELNNTEKLSRKQDSEKVADSLQWNEAKTRELLIDTLLVQAGWDVSNPELVVTEFEVVYPDNVSGKGYVDYVLRGDDGQPLAVIEAKRAGNESLQAGREQARLYADALENMGFQRPVIFYSNGYETFIWDDKQYNTYRPVYGFYSKSSLEYLIYQRQYRNATPE